MAGAPGAVLTRVRQLDVEEAAEAVRRGRAVILDCREPWELSVARLAGALAIPLGEIADRLDELPRDRAVLVICHHGVRSLHGAYLLHADGIDTASVRGGIDAWSARVDPGVPRY